MNQIKSQSWPWAPSNMKIWMLHCPLGGDNPYDGRKKKGKVQVKSEKKEKEKVKVQVKKRKEKGISISALLLIKDFFRKSINRCTKHESSL